MCVKERNRHPRIEEVKKRMRVFVLTVSSVSLCVVFCRVSHTLKTML